MNGKRVEYIFTISQEAFEIIRSKGGYLQSGGVRDAKGKFIELAIPAIQTVGGGQINFSVPGGVFSGVNMISSLIGNVQNVYIQKGINEANLKLDNLLAGQKNIMSGLQVVTGLEIANLALGLINVGISLKIKSQVTAVQHTLDDLKDRIEEQEFDKYEREYMEYSSKMTSFIDILGFSNFQINDATAFVVLSERLNEAEAYLRTIIKKFNERKIDGSLGCRIIFGLMPLYVQAVKIYSSKYYYTRFQIPDEYNKCLEVIEMINSASFRNAMEKYLIINRTDLILENKYSGLSQIANFTQECADYFQFGKKTWEILPQKTYENLDEIVTNKIKSNDPNIICDGGKVLIPIEVQNDDHVYLTREMIANGRKINQPTKRLSFDEMMKEIMGEE